MEIRHQLLIGALIVAAIFLLPSVYSLFSGEHNIYPSGISRCLKCHPDIRQDLDSSIHHTYFSCENCHYLNESLNQLHSSDVPGCLDCHGMPLRIVTDSNNNTFMTPLAQVFGENITNAESHNPFISGAVSNSLMKGENEACIFCHSDYYKNVNFTRPEFIEWDVLNSSGTWTISNLVIGQMKIINGINTTGNPGGKLHNINLVTTYTDCISCHEDIKQAALAGGHSNEQWRKNHNLSAYSDLNSYCKSCHKPLTQNNAGTSPYPANPFNLPVHNSMTISCMDCHGRSGNLFVDINGATRTPPYNSSSMGNIENSITLQPAFIQGYFCMACKNTGNPVPNNSLHFKYYTEPQVTIYVNGTQQYP
ncbi:MAG: hypothetical protein FIB07_02935 [Candidatus Methanoperedens sp.]|nr:hypothetical protein [Candidatus Methanoperedens sp.]